MPLGALPIWCLVADNPDAVTCASERSGNGMTATPAVNTASAAAKPMLDANGLEAYLRGRSRVVAVSRLDALDGYPTAVPIGPTFIAPPIWLGQLLGERALLAAPARRLGSDVLTHRLSGHCPAGATGLEERDRSGQARSRRLPGAGLHALRHGDHRRGERPRPGKDHPQPPRTRQGPPPQVHAVIARPEPKGALATLTAESQSPASPFLR